MPSAAAAVVGRFAPSPTGELHLGSALALLAAWASARSQGGRFLWRIEDLDGPRAVPGAAERQLDAARWLGLDWDAPPVRQSERGPHYADALRRLARAGRLFPCRVSRAELRTLASAPHGAGLPPFPPSLRPALPAPGWLDGAPPPHDAALRLLVDDAPVTFRDGVVGTVTEDVRAAVGDVVLRRRDGVFAYQLAVVVDDLAMGVTDVVRGVDLLGSTARQILLIEALGGAVPSYGHVPLLVNAGGEKLSKRDAVPGIRELRQAGVSAEAVVGWLAGALGQGGAPRAPSEVAETFSLGRVRPDPVVVPPDLADRLR